jgi:hypothetical protein
MPRDASLSLLFPITQQYPFYNEYLQPEFAASKAIDPHVAVADTPIDGAAPLKAPNGSTIGWVHPPPAGDLPELPANGIVWCWLLSLVFFAVWVHGWISTFVRSGGTFWGAVLVIVVSLGIRAILMLQGPPFHISETELFSPRLYASSALLPSLGDLLLHVLAVLWIVLFIAPRLRYHMSVRSVFLQWLSAIGICAGLFAAGVLFIRLVRSIVLDSLIPFDRAHLSSFDGSSLAGLIAVSLIMAILLIIAGVVRNTLKALLPSFGRQSLAILVSALLLLWLLRKDGLIDVYAIAMLWLAIGILGQYITHLS